MESRHCIPSTRFNTGRATCRTAGRATVGPTSAPLHRWTFGPVDRRRRYISMDIEAPRPLEPAAGVMSRRCWDRTRTRPTGVYTPLDRTTRTALPACTCLDPQPLARDPAGAGGVAWANQGWIGLPSRNGPGPRFGCIGKYRYIRSLPMSRWDLTPFPNRPFEGGETGELQSRST